MSRAGAKAWVFGLALGALIVLSACGKYAPPRPPEDFSPREVQALAVSASLQGVKFEWKAPEKTMRMKELKTIDGYHVYRKEIKRTSDIMDRAVEFDLLASLPDTHLLELEKLREEARQADKPTRRVKIDDEKKKFEYTDTSVQSGKTYAYRIVPFNQGSVEGNYSELIKVLFRGDSSEIALIPFRAFTEEAFE